MNNQRNDGPSVEQLRAELERVRYRRRYMSTLRSTIYMLVALATVVLLAVLDALRYEHYFVPLSLRSLRRERLGREVPSRAGWGAFWPGRTSPWYTHTWMPMAPMVVLAVQKP